MLRTLYKSFLFLTSILLCAGCIVESLRFDQLKKIVAAEDYVREWLYSLECTCAQSPERLDLDKDSARVLQEISQELISSSYRLTYVDGADAVRLFSLQVCEGKRFAIVVEYKFGDGRQPESYRITQLTIDE